MRSEDIGVRIAAIEQQFADQVRQNQQLTATLLALIARFGDPAYVSVREAAEIERRLYGKGSPSSVRRRIAAGEYTLLKAKGAKASVIAIAQIHEVYRKSLQPAAPPARSPAEAAKRRR